MKKVTLPKQGSVSVKLRKQKRNRKVLVLPLKINLDFISAIEFVFPLPVTVEFYGLFNVA